MAFALRFGGYIGGGGLLLALMNPPVGPVRWLIAILYIIAASYLDMLFTGGQMGASRTRGNEGVVRMDAYRAGKRSAGGQGGNKPERRVPRHLFETEHQVEAEGLLTLLRGKGLHPIMVTRRTPDSAAPVMFEVRLPEPELARAKSLMSQFIARKSAPLN